MSKTICTGAAQVQTIKPVTAEMCQKQMRHCHSWIEQSMQSQEGGNLQQFATLQALMLLAAALIQTENIDLLPLYMSYLWGYRGLCSNWLAAVSISASTSYSSASQISSPSSLGHRHVEAH